MFLQSVHAVSTKSIEPVRNYIVKQCFLSLEEKTSQSQMKLKMIEIVIDWIFVDITNLSIYFRLFFMSWTQRFHFNFIIDLIDFDSFLNLHIPQQDEL